MATKVRTRRTARSVSIDKLPQREGAQYQTTYANHVEVGVSPWDFRLLFFDVTEDETGNLVQEKKVRVVMSPQYVVAFLKILEGTIEQWPKEFGYKLAEPIEVKGK